jgi:hypothetical protein
VLTSLLTLVAVILLALFTVWLNIQFAKDVELARVLGTQAFPDVQKVKSQMNITFATLHDYVVSLSGGISRDPIAGKTWLSTAIRNEPTQKPASWPTTVNRTIVSTITTGKLLSEWSVASKRFLRFFYFTLDRKARGVFTHLSSTSEVWLGYNPTI